MTEIRIFRPGDPSYPATPALRRRLARLGILGRGDHKPRKKWKPAGGRRKPHGQDR